MCMISLCWHISMNIGSYEMSTADHLVKHQPASMCWWHINISWDSVALRSSTEIYLSTFGISWIWPQQATNLNHSFKMLYMDCSVHSARAAEFAWILNLFNTIARPKWHLRLWWKCPDLVPHCTFSQGTDICKKWKNYKKCELLFHHFIWCEQNWKILFIRSPHHKKNVEKVATNIASSICPYHNRQR